MKDILSKIKNMEAHKKRSISMRKNNDRHHHMLMIENKRMESKINKLEEEIEEIKKIKEIISKYCNNNYDLATKMIIERETLKEKLDIIMGDNNFQENILYNCGISTAQFRERIKEELKKRLKK